MQRIRSLIILTSVVVVSVMALGAAAIAANGHGAKDLTPPPAGPPGDVEKANRGAREIDGPNGEKIMIVPEQRPADIAR